MNYLLDTCALIALTNGSAEFSSRGRTVIADPSAQIMVSVITAAEISIKVGKGKYQLPMPVVDWVEGAVRQHRLRLLPLELHPASTAGKLPWHHSDPFDRILIATAIERNLTIITSDKLIAQYSEVITLW